MSQKEVQLDQKIFSCSICLEPLKDPVTIHCGHSFCMNCIKGNWDEEDQKKLYSCPQCSQTFTTRPHLVKNTMLAALELPKSGGLQAAPADHCYAGAEDVACDVCTGRKLKALKSSLQCRVSFCDGHLEPHHELPVYEKHKLVDPSRRLRENICSRHSEVMKIFCSSDQQFICYLCSLDEHRGHDKVSAAAERTERQRELEESRYDIQLRIQCRQKDLKLLQKEEEAIGRSADRTVEDSQKIFTQLIQLMAKRWRDVEQRVRSQQEAEVSQVKELEEKLEQEISELKRRDTELQKIFDTEDHGQFLQDYPSLSGLSGSTNSSSINIRPLRHFDDVTVAVSEFRAQLQQLLRDTWTNISLAVTEVDVLLSGPEPKTRAGFLKYSREITLDPDTAYRYLMLSDGNRKATRMSKEQSYPDRPERFTDHCQVLSRESLTGRCYWELQWSGRRVDVAVTYKDIRREGSESSFGFTDKSWRLICGGTLRHNNRETPAPGLCSSRVGLYLDHRAGLLSVYSITETMTLIHRVRTIFTQPLHVGLMLDCASTVELCEVKQTENILG